MEHRIELDMEGEVLVIEGTNAEVRDYMKRLEIAFGSKALMQDVFNSLKKPPRLLAGYEDGKFIISITHGAQNLNPKVSEQIFKAGYKHDNMFVPMKIGARFSKARI